MNNMGKTWKNLLVETCENDGIVWYTINFEHARPGGDRGLSKGGRACLGLRDGGG